MEITDIKFRHFSDDGRLARWFRSRSTRFSLYMTSKSL